MSKLKVKNCPCRKKCRESVRYYGTDIFYSCIFPEGNSGRKDTNSDFNIDCKLHGSTNISKCQIYNEWSLKQIRKAFSDLEQKEKELAAFREVLKL